LKRKGFAVLAALAAGGLFAYALLRPAAPQRGTFLAFGGITEVELRAQTDAIANDAFAAVAQILARDQREWHPWEMSDLMRLNAAIEQGQPYTVPAGLAGLIRRAQDGYVRSGGLFNPAIGGLVGLWGFHTSDYPIRTPRPPPEAIARLMAGSPRMDDLTVGENGEVASRNRAVDLDLNGLAEGYAAEQIAEELARRGIAHALINVGGDVLALGDAGERPWRVVISSPQHAALASAQLSGREALFSSGNYNKFREEPGQRWGHVLDPRTGEPAHGVAAVSVIHPDAVIADIASTTLMISGSGNIVAAARGLGVACVVLVEESGTVWMTPAMRDRLEFSTPPIDVRTTENTGENCQSPR
jgi:thiamine biosynthesis lipoprotein